MNTNSKTLNKELAKLAKSSEWQERLKARRWLNKPRSSDEQLPNYVAKYIVSILK